MNGSHTTISHDDPLLAIPPPGGEPPPPLLRGWLWFGAWVEKGGGERVPRWLPVQRCLGRSHSFFPPSFSWVAPREKDGGGGERKRGIIMRQSFSWPLFFLPPHATTNFPPHAPLPNCCFLEWCQVNERLPFKVFSQDARGGKAHRGKI